MNEIKPSKDKFEVSLKKLENCAKGNTEKFQLQKFQEKDSIIGFFDRTVKAHELNNYSIQLQNAFIHLNDRINDFYKQFADVYTTFAVLDKEYIAGIVEDFNQAIEATRKAEAAQADINKTVKSLEKIVTSMLEFKNEVNKKIKAMDDAILGYDIVKHEQELQELEKNGNNILQILETYKNQSTEILDSLNQDVNYIDGIKKAFDGNILELKNSIEKLNDLRLTIVDEISNRLNSFNIDISSEIKNFNNEISNRIISFSDEMASQMDSNKNEIKTANALIEQLIRKNDNNKNDLESILDNINIYLKEQFKDINAKIDLGTDYICKTFNGKVFELNTLINNYNNAMYDYYNVQKEKLNEISTKIETLDNRITIHEKKNKTRFIVSIIGISISICILIVILVLICIKL